MASPARPSARARTTIWKLLSEEAGFTWLVVRHVYRFSLVVGAFWLLTGLFARLVDEPLVLALLSGADGTLTLIMTFILARNLVREVNNKSPKSKRRIDAFTVLVAFAL